MRNSQKGWPMRRIGEIADVISGATPRTNNQAYWDGDILWATPKDLGKLKAIEISDTERKITKKGYESCSSKVLPVGSVLLSSRAPIGHLAINAKPMCTNQGFKSLIPHEGIDNRFLYWVLKGSIDELQGMGRGCTFDEISKDQVESFIIPVPPLDEQHRIVARIEELTHRAEELQRLRTAAALEVSRIFQTAMERIFAPQETGNWEKFESTYVFDIVRGQVDPMESPYSDLPHVAPDCIESGTGRILVNKVKTPRELRLASGKYHFRENHVLYSKIRPNLRKVALPSFEGTCSADMYSLIPNPELVTREFLALALLSPPFTQYAVENSDRNAMPKINRPKLFAYKMKLPRIEIQKKITAKINEIQDRAEEIHAMQEKNEQDMAKFQPALFAKAFRGEL